MKSFALLFCVFSVVSFGRIDGHNPFSKNPGPHEGEHADCKGTRMELNGQMKEVKCMPRKSLAKLIPEPGYAFFPNIVSVNRCDGLCGSNLSCMRVESIVKPIMVRRHHIKSSDFSCYRVYVEEHRKCKCKCNVMESDCNKNQIYIPDDCACKCMNYAEQDACSQMKGMIWNPEKCKCTCVMPEEECSSGLEWIPSLCRCGKVMMSLDEAI